MFNQDYVIRYAIEARNAHATEVGKALDSSVVAALHRTSEHALQQLRASILCARIAAKRRALDDPKEARKQNEQVPETSGG